VLLERAADLRQRQFLNVIPPQPEAVVVAQPRNGTAERLPQQRQMARPVGIRRRHARRLVRTRSILAVAFFVWQRHQAPLGAEPIDVALREHGSQPRRQAAPPLEVAKERPPSVHTVSEAVQIGVQGIGELPGASGGIEGVGGTVEHGPVLQHKAPPGVLVSSGALLRELEVVGVPFIHARPPLPSPSNYRLPASA
jgi:hypothetical protein